jgi:hypothetical protein
MIGKIKRGQSKKGMNTMNTDYAGIKDWPNQNIKSQQRKGRETQRCLETW